MQTHPPSPNYEVSTPAGSPSHYLIAATRGRKLREVVVSPNLSGGNLYIQLWKRNDLPPEGTPIEVASKTLYDTQEGYYNFLPDGLVFPNGIVVTVSTTPDEYSPGPETFTITVKFGP